MSKAITPENFELYYDLRLPDKLIEAAYTDRDKAFLSTLARGFARVTEVLLLEVPKVDFEGGSLLIPGRRKQTKIQCPNCSQKLTMKYRFCSICGNEVPLALREKTEQRCQRIIPINRGTLDLIERYLEWRRRFTYQGELLFPFSRQRAWQIVEKLGRRIGIKGLHPESLRNLLAARWVNKGLDIGKLKYLMGYADTAAHPPSFSFEQLKSEYEKLWET